MTYAMSKAEAELAVGMLVRVLEGIRSDQVAGVLGAPVRERDRGGRPHIHTCSSCSARWDEGFSTGKSQACHSGYPQGLPARMSEPGTVAPVPALTIAPGKEPMMTEDCPTSRPSRKAG